MRGRRRGRRAATASPYVVGARPARATSTPGRGSPSSGDWSNAAFWLARRRPLGRAGRRACAASTSPAAQGDLAGARTSLALRSGARGAAPPGAGWAEVCGCDPETGERCAAARRRGRCARLSPTSCRPSRAVAAVRRGRHARARTRRACASRSRTRLRDRARRYDSARSAGTRGPLTASARHRAAFPARRRDRRTRRATTASPWPQRWAPRRPTGRSRRAGRTPWQSPTPGSSPTSSGSAGRRRSARDGYR